MSWKDVNNKLIFINGVSGSGKHALARRLESEGYGKVLDVDLFIKNCNNPADRYKLLSKAFKTASNMLYKSNVILVGHLTLDDEKLISNYFGFFKVVSILLVRDLNDCYKETGSKLTYAQFQKRIAKERQLDICFCKVTYAFKYPYLGVENTLDKCLNTAERVWRVC